MHPTRKKRTSMAIAFLMCGAAAVKLRTPETDSADITFERMRYWQSADRALPPQSKYLLFTQDLGATNNLRIGWEMVGVVARETGRTLVLPPAKPIYLLDFGLNMGARTKYLFPQFSFEDAWHKGNEFYTVNATTATKVEDLVNLDQLRAFVPTLTWEEFHAKTGLDFQDAKSKSEQVLYKKTSDIRKENSGVCHALTEFQAVGGEMLYMDGDHLRQGFACGDWDGLGGPRRSDWRKSMHDQSWALLTHGFVWHPDAFSIASKVVNHLGLFEYNALHARYGDFQYDSSKAPPSKIFKNWPSLAEGVKFLYVATDSPDKFEDVWHENVKILRWDDLFDPKKAGPALAAAFTTEKAKYTPERWWKLMGPVEEIICTYARLFVGTLHSSFSGHIQRMRMHTQAPYTKQLFHTQPETQAVKRSLRERLAGHYRARKSASQGDIFLQVN